MEIFVGGAHAQFCIGQQALQNGLLPSKMVTPTLAGTINSIIPVEVLPPGERCSIYEAAAEAGSWLGRAAANGCAPVRMPPARKPISKD